MQNKVGYGPGVATPGTNLSDLLTRIWRGGDPSRADLARQTGLSRSAVTHLVQQLLDGGLVTESHVGRSSGGRPPVILRFCQDRARLIGVDLGASHVTVLATGLRGRVLASETVDHDVEADPAGTLSLVIARVQALIDAPDAPPVLGLGVAVPCPLERGEPGQLSPRILPAWAGIRPAEVLSQALGQPVVLDNDANLAALAELWWGQGQGGGDFAFIKLGTGVGAGLIIGGDVYRGSGGLAGEIGHTAVGARGRICRCGLEGCLEVLIGSDALEERAQEALALTPSAALGPRPDVDALVVAAGEGEPVALALIEEAGQALGVAVANLVNLLNPDRIILGGRVSRAGEALLRPLRVALASRAMSSSVLAAEVLVSSLGREGVALGAATQVLRAALADPARLISCVPVGAPSPEPLHPPTALCVIP